MDHKPMEGKIMTHILKTRAALGCIAVLAFLTSSFAQQPASLKGSLHIPPHGPSFKDKRARNFVIHDLSGKSVSLKDFTGRPVVVNFWATWCPPCLQEIPWFEELTREHAGSGVAILGLSVDIESDSASPQKIAATVKRLGITYPILLPDKSIHELYGPVHQLPETFYINRKGVIVEDVWGSADKESIEKYVREIVN
jgi:thiol-disulfide isomerase/thioredoxin